MEDEGTLESLNPSMSIKDFKRLILSLNGNFAFFLKFNIDNDKTLLDLVNLT